MHAAQTKRRTQAIDKEDQDNSDEEEVSLNGSLAEGSNIGSLGKEV